MRLTDFDRIVCLAVDRRKDSWKSVAQQVEKRGACVDFFVVGDGKLLPLVEYDRLNSPAPPTFNGFPNSYNAFRSFQTIIHRCFAAGLRSVLLLEDDVEFLPEFDDVMLKVGKQIDRWDMLYLGANHSFNATYEISPNLLKVHGSLCFHAVAISDRCFPAIMSWEPILPIDLMAARMLHTSYNCLAVWPNIAIQKPGFSVVEGRVRDYSNFWSCPGNPRYSHKDE